MEIIKPDGKLDADVIDEILRVKERTARSRERRDWAAISASALGVVLLAAGIATAVMSGGSSEGASPAPPSSVRWDGPGWSAAGCSPASSSQAASRRRLSGADRQ